MKRIFFHQSPDQKTITTSETICGLDVYKGEIHLGSNSITWQVVNSANQVIDSGKATQVSYAQKAIKKCFINLGAKIEPEHRKYKI